MATRQKKKIDWTTRREHRLLRKVRAMQPKIAALAKTTESLRTSSDHSPLQKLIESRLDYIERKQMIVEIEHAMKLVEQRLMKRLEEFERTVMARLGSDGM